jgi:hypothetical protein
MHDPISASQRICVPHQVWVCHHHRQLPPLLLCALLQQHPHCVQAHVPAAAIWYSNCLCAVCQNEVSLTGVIYHLCAIRHTSQLVKAWQKAFACCHGKKRLLVDRATQEYAHQTWCITLCQALQLCSKQQASWQQACLSCIRKKLLSVVALVGAGSVAVNMLQLDWQHDDDACQPTRRQPQSAWQQTCLLLPFRLGYHPTKYCVISSPAGQDPPVRWLPCCSK